MAEDKQDGHVPQHGHAPQQQRTQQLLQLRQLQFACRSEPHSQFRREQLSETYQEILAQLRAEHPPDLASWRQLPRPTRRELTAEEQRLQQLKRWRDENHQGVGPHWLVRLEQHMQQLQQQHQQGEARDPQQQHPPQQLQLPEEENPWDEWHRKKAIIEQEESRCRPLRELSQLQVQPKAPPPAPTPEMWQRRLRLLQIHFPSVLSPSASSPGSSSEQQQLQQQLQQQQEQEDGFQQEQQPQQQQSQKRGLQQIPAAAAAAEASVQHN